MCRLRRDFGFRRLVITSLDCPMQYLDTTGMLAVMGDVSSEGIYNAPVASSDENAPTGSARFNQALARVRAERAGLPGGIPSRKKRAVLNRRIKRMEEKLERWGCFAAPHNCAPVNVSANTPRTQTLRAC